VVESTTLEPEDAWQLDSQAAIPDELKANVLGFSPPPSPPQTSMLQVRFAARLAATRNC
jgi:hypothetical protein